MQPLPVTVVVPIKNEEKNLGACLSRLSDFAAIWVVDSASSDASLDIARRFDAKILQFEWKGGFPKKRNWVLQTQELPTPWVLFLDADEHVTPEFVAELRVALTDSDCVGYWLNYHTHFMGRILKHGLPQRKLALFRSKAGFYERIEDSGWSSLDMEVHEHPVLEGKIGTISAKMDHLDFRGIEHYVARHNAYSTWEAQRYGALMHDKAAAWSQLTPRQRTKYSHLRRWWFAPMFFLMTYIGRLGFLDGMRGLDFALLKFSYFHNIRLKIIELEQR